MAVPQSWHRLRNAHCLWLRIQGNPVLMDKVAVLKEMFGGDWREHPDAPNYFFSSCGHAARVTVRKGVPYATLLKGCSCSIGYRAISHPIGRGRYGRIYIHRAVCLLFNGPPPDGSTVVRHLDTCLNNNRASNLAWGSALDNANDAKNAGKSPVGERNGMAKLTRALVHEMRIARKERGMTFKQLARDFGVSTMTAYRAATEKSWK